MHFAILRNKTTEADDRIDPLLFSIKLHRNGSKNIHFPLGCAFFIDCELTEDYDTRWRATSRRFYLATTCRMRRHIRTGHRAWIIISTYVLAAYRFSPHLLIFSFDKILIQLLSHQSPASRVHHHYKLTIDGPFHSHRARPPHRLSGVRVCCVEW